MLSGWDWSAQREGNLVGHLTELLNVNGCKGRGVCPQGKGQVVEPYIKFISPPHSLESKMDYERLTSSTVYSPVRDLQSLVQDTKESGL